MLEDNDITANAMEGVEIKTDGNPRCAETGSTAMNQAIQVYESGKGVVEDNDLADNKQGAWYIEADSEGNVTRARNRE